MTDVLTELIAYVRAHTSQAPGDAEGEAIHNVHFMRIATDEAATDPAPLVALLERCLTERAGEFGEFDRDRLTGGPSYIELGGWVGDQGLAFQLMACGEAAGLWGIISPEKLGITGPEADQLAGNGMVMIDGYRPIPATPLETP